MLKRAGIDRVRASDTQFFPAPASGWVQSGNIATAPLTQAEVLDNLIPTAQGARLRGGASIFADVGAAVKSLVSYSSGASRDLFAATATQVFDADRVAGGANDFAEIEGLSSGDWSDTQISTSGGQFTVMVNGADPAHYWDGADWYPINTAAINNLGFDAETAAFTVGDTVTGGTSGATAAIVSITKASATTGTLRLGAITGTFQNDEAITDGAGGAAVVNGTASVGSSITLTNVATTALSQVWLFKERLFFVEKDTASVWYLPVESIGGAASEINLGSIFRQGGSVMFGATWSLDSGSGIDDVCIMVSTNGEIAVYEGTDPGSASTWSLVGVYEVGRPLNKNAYFKAGGDLAILTTDGIIPVSQVLQRDRASLQSAAISYPIEDAWQDAVSGATADYPVSVSLWQSGTLLLIGTPSRVSGKNVSFAANARTGAWCRITGWDVRCSVVSGENLYFGNAAGEVLQADTGGNDAGAAYTAVYVGKYAQSDVLQSANAIGMTYKAADKIDFNLQIAADYQTPQIDAPAPIVTPETSTWGAGVWGTFKWGDDGNTSTFTEWQFAGANGYSFAPVVALTSNQTAAAQFEILATRMRTERGYAL